MEVTSSRIFFPLSPVVKRFIESNSWIRSPAWDMFWLHSGIWLTFLLLMVSSSQLQEMFYATAVFLFWIAHRFSSFYLAWGTQGYKPLRRDQQKRFIILPLMIGLGVFAVLFTPVSLLAFTVRERIFALLLIDFFGEHIILRLSIMEFSSSIITAGILKPYQTPINMTVYSAG